MGPGHGLELSWSQATLDPETSDLGLHLLKFCVPFEDRGPRVWRKSGRRKESQLLKRQSKVVNGWAPRLLPVLVFCQVKGQRRISREIQL